MNTLRVAVAGAGLGGLCLAQGLLRAGVGMAVGDYERQMREYGYAAVAASRQAEAQTGVRRSRLLFALYRRRPRLP